eukprot:CAMPEP_0174976056 /NCGR_PEP_ID=MMETSP0004_2-20121128/12808_1 /TAXON_ID=420556 /ORGANISM="Ochromonas sp., Strain CCMP1393" /LENGTH=264 /DNA_ID=CAMNT_0016227019 /DNA_START=235 /DNA_END=1033 /DNA_ORIENTATION=+
MEELTEQLSRRQYSDLHKCAVGASTIVSERQLMAVRKAGASFFSTTFTQPDLIHLGESIGLPCLCGFQTCSDAVKACDSNAAALKVYPASTLSPDALSKLITHLGSLKNTRWHATNRKNGYDQYYRMSDMKYSVHPSLQVQPRKAMRSSSSSSSSVLPPVIVSGGLTEGLLLPYLAAGASGFALGLDFDKLTCDEISTRLRRMDLALQDAVATVTSSNSCDSLVAKAMKASKPKDLQIPVDALAVQVTPDIRVSGLVEAGSSII